MKPKFYIVLNLKTAGGFESYARFFIGTDPGSAYSLFAKLEGNQNVHEDDILHMDLIETMDGLPLNIRVINCTLDELTANCRAITKEVFKILNMEEMGH
jgi:hypothetical protein